MQKNRIGRMRRPLGVVIPHPSLATKGLEIRRKQAAKTRVLYLREELEKALRSRDEANALYPEGIDAAFALAHAKTADLKKEEAAISAPLESRKKNSAARMQQLETNRGKAQVLEIKAATAERAANRHRESALAERASEQGRLHELRKQRDAANLPLAEDYLKQKKQQLHLLPIPERTVSDAEVAAARGERFGVGDELALEETGGSVARERPSNAEEAWHIAEQREREIEAEYEAWKLLLEQRKEADAANLAPSRTNGASKTWFTGKVSEQSQQRRAATRATHGQCLGTQSTHS